MAKWRGDYHDDDGDDDDDDYYIGERQENNETLAKVASGWLGDGTTEHMVQFKQQLLMVVMLSRLIRVEFIRKELSHSRIITIQNCSR